MRWLTCAFVVRIWHKTCFRMTWPIWHINWCVSGSSVLPTRDEIDHNKSLSRDLYQVMENIGVTTEWRDTRKEMARTIEILLTVNSAADFSNYIFGSYYEGTFTPDMGSDMDDVVIKNDIPVVTSIGDCPHHVYFGLLLVPDKQPGYAKVQVVTNGKPAFTDIKDFMALNRLYGCKADKDNRLCLIPNPDQVLQGKTYAYDLLHAKCTNWPGLASEWLHRQRNNGWPSAELIEECKCLGFLVVSASHPESDEKEFQCRISFPEQERLLVTQFNSVQLMCYILLKIIENEVVKKKIKEDTLTTYYCKTCMLYMLETTPRELWIPENLVSCLIMCLRQIHVWVKDDNCPNYFIPDENMFDKITDVELKRKLQEVLDTILKSDIRTVLEQLTKSYQTRQNQGQAISYGQLCKVNAMRTLLGTALNVRNSFLRDHYDRTLDSFINNLKDTYRNFEGTKTITDHSEKETRTALSLILPFIKTRVIMWSCSDGSGKRGISGDPYM